MQKIAASRPGAWFFSRTLHHFDRAVLALTGGRTTLAAVMAGLPVVVLVTTGAKSGLSRENPLLYIRDESNPSTFAIVGSNWGQRRYPAWYFNLKANPHAVCSIRGKTGEYLAHEAVGDEYERFWQRATNTYIGFPLYKQRASGRRIPIMVMTPLEK
jgi:deazaflavin-dependent oxidoreductase (nitroreductase family)